MTLVAAFRSLDRIISMSDTLISNRDSPRPNAVPGRLKSVVVNRWLTISYAGLSSQALDCIRIIRATRGLTTNQAISLLSAFSTAHNGDVEFIVCSHEEHGTPRLVKIHHELVSEGQDMYWIGDADAARQFSRLELRPLQGEAEGEYYTLEERRFARRFHEFMAANPVSSVGGLVVEALASPYGHCYNENLGVFVDRVTVPDPLEPTLRAEMNKAGMNGYYSYAVLSSAERGEAVVGMYFAQAEMGYIHTPLVSDDAVKVSALTQEEFQAVIRSHTVQGQNDA